MNSLVVRFSGMTLVFCMFCSVSFANNEEIQQTVFGELAIDATSVRLASFQRLDHPDQYEAVLSFDTLPQSDCQRNYAGFFKTQIYDFRAVYATEVGTRCRALSPASPHPVAHRLKIQFPERRPQGTYIQLNGNRFRFSLSGTELRLERVAP